MKPPVRTLKKTGARGFLIDRLIHVDLYRYLTQTEDGQANTHTHLQYTGQHTYKHLLAGTSTHTETDAFLKINDN